MAEKNIKSRIVHKHDTEASWIKATNFIPKKGEIIVYDIDSTHTYERIKIGDGETSVNALPFSTDSIVESMNTQISGLQISINNVSDLVGDTAVSTQISNYAAPKSHTHDDRYYTESEIDNKLSKKSDTSHTHSAYVNQNAFSNVVVGSTTVAADSATDTLTLVAGRNVTLTPDATNDKITIAATDTVYTHPTYTARTGVPTANATPAFGGTFSVSQPVSDATGHITAINSRTVTIPSTAATTSAAGLMSASDKTKLDGIETGATKITVDSALSSTSKNPVQNKAVNSAISNLSNLVGDTAVSEQIANAIVSEAYSLTDRGTLIPDNSDLNDYTTAGNYYVSNSNSATTIANTPFTSAGYRLICQIGYTTNNSSYMYQIAFGTKGNIKFRCYSTSAWGDWISYSKTDHTHSYLSLDGGTLTGNLTTKTLTISGTEVGLTHLKFSRESANYICFPSNGSLSINAEDSASSISAASLLINSTDVKPGKSNSIDLGTTDNKWNNVYATTFNGALSGNAATATKLATARTLTIGGTGKTFNGSGNVSWTLSEIGATVSNTITGGTTSGPTIKTTVNGVTGSAVTIPSASLTASGIVTTGTQEFKGLKTFHGARFKIDDDASQQSIYYNSNSGVILADIFVSQGDTTNITEVKYCVRLRSPNSTPNASTTGKSEFFAFPSPTAGRTADAYYNVLTTKNTITVPQGGTGATNKSGARTNLGITSGTSLPSASGSSYSAGDIFILY